MLLYEFVESLIVLVAYGLQGRCERVAVDVHTKAHFMQRRVFVAQFRVDEAEQNDRVFG